MKRWLLHPIRTYKVWKRQRQHVVNSQVNLYISRKHLAPLEQCTREQLEASIRHNQREARRYEKAYKQSRRSNQNYDALATWHRLCQIPLQELVDLLEDGQQVHDLPWKKRRKPTEELMRIRKLG